LLNSNIPKNWERTDKRYDIGHDARIN
jgi:hypothetical protein